jgi:RNA polymerase sigma factor (sigma-70 family)
LDDVIQGGLLSQAERDAHIHRHLGRIHLIAWRLKRNLPPCFDIHDLEQAGVMALMDAGERYDPGQGPFWAFVRARVYGAMVDMVRSGWKDSLHEELCDVGRRDVSPDAAPEALAIAAERSRILRRLMLRLTLKQRRVIERKCAGEKPKEIARSLGIKTVTVNVLTYQAIQRMRAHRPRSVRDRPDPQTGITALLALAGTL